LVDLSAGSAGIINFHCTTGIIPGKAWVNGSYFMEYRRDNTVDYLRAEFNPKINDPDFKIYSYQYNDTTWEQIKHPPYHHPAGTTQEKWLELFNMGLEITRNSDDIEKTKEGEEALDRLLRCGSNNPLIQNLKK
jgi:hypothetical protein